MSIKNRIVAGSVAAVSVLALSACGGGVPSGYEEKVVSYDNGAFALYIPEDWTVNSMSEYTPGSESYWAASLDEESSVGTADNPGVVVIYQDLDEDEAADIKENFKELPEQVLGSEDYSDFKTDDKFKIDGASQAFRMSGEQDGTTLDLVAAIAKDERSLAMIMVGYNGNDLDPKDANTITESFRFDLDK